jgi:hypothetical protein
VQLRDSNLYGSTWLPSGAGSVIMLTGKACDPIVSMRHLKQPPAEVGPFRIHHNCDTGRSSVWEGVDLVLPPAEKEKARRRLESLTDKGQLFVLDPGDSASKRPTIWAAK